MGGQPFSRWGRGSEGYILAVGVEGREGINISRAKFAKARIVNLRQIVQAKKVVSACPPKNDTGHQKCPAGYKASTRSMPKSRGDMRLHEGMRNCTVAQRLKMLGLRSCAAERTVWMPLKHGWSSMIGRHPRLCYLCVFYFCFFIWFESS